ncbi:hypothetical protein MATL_G00247350 [Megalops atlanticus]|uniref:Nuclear receptor interacting protein 2 n=1 Tax=Megalops atlanticus TaxID=7932 RepID=A0A9D3PCH8_MEGAT|nr:hypothetical protein MATL_G00247350 [Megalops atlanticus]
MSEPPPTLSSIPLQQPHSIVQRRLLEGNITRLRGETRDPASRVRSPLADNKEGTETEERSESTADDSTEERESPEESEKSLRSEEEEEEEEEGGESERKREGEEEEEKQTAEEEKTQEERRPKAEEGKRALILTALVVKCKCCETEVKASINTGCQQNRISSACCRRLGLMPTTVDQDLLGGTTQPHTVEGLQLQLGKERTQCSAHVVEDDVFELCLGLQTLLELKCCLDLSTRVLKLQGSGEELPFLEPTTDSQYHHDNNKNTTM